jgi:hypothetical protein
MVTAKGMLLLQHFDAAWRQIAGEVSSIPHAYNTFQQT